MQRRELFVILGAGMTPMRGFAQQKDAPLFFSPDQLRLAEVLADVLLPSDEQSPGALEAGAVLQLDRGLASAVAAEQQEWRHGLETIAALGRERFGRPLVECSRREQEQLIASLAAREAAPESEAERFFGVLKWKVVDLYCGTEIGRKQYLRYRGDTVIAEFPGCTHAQHQT